MLRDADQFFSVGTLTAHKSIDREKSQQMDQNQQDESHKRAERATRLLKEAIKEANISDYTEYLGTAAYFARYWNIDPKDADKISEWPNQRWNVFKVEYPKDVVLLIQINRPEGLAWIETPLLGPAWDLIKGAEQILDAPDATKLFVIESTEDREEAIDFNVRAALVNYINFLPVMLAKAVEGAYEDSIERQVKLSIEPQMREHWHSIGLPDGFSILGPWERYSYTKQLEEFRKVFVGKAKPAIPDNLPQMYGELRLAYKKARNHHNDSRKIFLASNRDDEDAWRKYWDQNCMQMFPQLAYGCLMLLCDTGHQQNSITPSELATKHLSFLFSRSPEYMRKQVTALRNKKSKNASA